MGSQIAQQNVLYLYDTLMLSDCAEDKESNSKHAGGSSGSNSSTLSKSTSKSNRKKGKGSSQRENSFAAKNIRSYPNIFGDKNDKNLENENGNEKDSETSTASGSVGTDSNGSTFSSRMYVLPGKEGEHSEESSVCRVYLNSMTKIRLTQLANAGNYYAARRLADIMMEGEGGEESSSEDKKGAAR